MWLLFNHFWCYWTVYHVSIDDKTACSISEPTTISEGLSYKEYTCYNVWIWSILDWSLIAINAQLQLSAFNFNFMMLWFMPCAVAVNYLFYYSYSICYLFPGSCDFGYLYGGYGDFTFIFIMQAWIEYSTIWWSI